MVWATLTTTQLCSRESEPRSCLGNKGAIVVKGPAKAQRRGQASGGYRGGTVEVLAIKCAARAAGEPVCFGRCFKQTQLLYYHVLLNTGKTFRRIAMSQS